MTLILADDGKHVIKVDGRSLSVFRRDEPSDDLLHGWDVFPVAEFTVSEYDARAIGAQFTA